MREFNAGSVSNQLEKLVDSNSLQSVVDVLATICHGKAEHIETNWQDVQLAKVWQRAASKLEKLAASIGAMEL